ncbi:FAD-dependent oxidoreductase [Amycolatopsis cynarae]|uniref:FAD-dependent oxidoreductase n=1 Tax=Amycolatopsis cynarae TaxID=2995223 RepID=A0ABY7BDE7_9PSEU|nr:FAD-dependent oxidoreductase [Amycolatopsis sp. HUAS 11-8]WAL68648.1 FAD-dependent oxidoreductase [Amycolatopsis sp. HUAS 11-8]
MSAVSANQSANQPAKAGTGGRAHTRVDVAVLGAGIVGCLTAREIVHRSPAASVMLIDRDAVGGGASLRSAGLHTPRGTTARVRRMTRYSQRFYTELRRARPGLPIHPVPMTVVGPRDGQPLEGTYLAESGPVPTRELPEGVRLPDGTAAWEISGCHYAVVPTVAQAVATDLGTGADVREAVRVHSLDVTADDVRLRLGTGETVTADRVVLAPGPWLSATPWAGLVAPLGARVKKVVALHIRCRPGPDDRAVLFQQEDAFLLPLPGRGHWLFSYTCPEWDADPDSPATGLTAKNLVEAKEILRRYAPGMADACASGRVFCDAYSGTGEPVVRPLDEGGRVVFAGAANGSGYRLAPAIAAEAADLLQLAGSGL